jgi:hypothetical protein
MNEKMKPFKSFITIGIATTKTTTLYSEYLETNFKSELFCYYVPRQNQITTTITTNVSKNYLNLENLYTVYYIELNIILSFL